jgi:hypothetical protein
MSPLSASGRALPLLLLAGAAACSGPATPSSSSKFFTPPTGESGVSSETNFERYFPLVDGNLFQYATENALRERGILIARVHRTDATHGELVYPTGKKRFSYSREGVRIEPAGNFLIAGPLVAGASFRGQNGGRAVIEAVAVVMDVRAGSYQGCVRVVETRGGDSPARYTTTFCPDVGVVAIEAQAGPRFERAELVSSGPPVNLEADGVTFDSGAGQGTGPQK